MGACEGTKAPRTHDALTTNSTFTSLIQGAYHVASTQVVSTWG
jgi:hypothetical protein